MRLTPQGEHLEPVAAAFVDAAYEVVELRDLPAIGLLDPATRPEENLVVAAQLGHRLADPDELIRRAEVAAEQRDDRLTVPVEHRQALTCPFHREVVLAVGALRDRASVHGQTAISQSIRVTDGVDLEEVLIVAAEPHHPARELDRIGDPGVAHARMQLQKLTREIADGPVGVVSATDHPHDAPNRTLQQRHEITRRRPLHRQPQHLDDRAGSLCPLRALPIPEKPARAQPAINLRTQLGEIASRTRRRQPNLTLDVHMTIAGRHQQRPHLLDPKPADDLAELALSAPRP